MASKVKIDNDAAYNFRLDEIADAIEEVKVMAARVQTLMDGFILSDGYDRSDLDGSDAADSWETAEAYIKRALSQVQGMHLVRAEREIARKLDHIPVIRG